MIGKVSHQFSKALTVASEVPQGSVLGPLLFLLYINFLTYDINLPTKIFADDLKLYFTITSSLSTTVQDMLIGQCDVNTWHKVPSSWSLSMNANKCVVLRFC